MTQETLSYPEVLALLLIYAGHEDYDFSDEEKEAIQLKVGKENYNKMLSKFNKLGDYQVLQTILDHKSLYFDTPEKKEALISEMVALFQQDGDYSSIEKTLLNFLDRMMA